jgi:hypothetical protein
MSGDGIRVIAFIGDGVMLVFCVSCVVHFCFLLLLLCASVSTGWCCYFFVTVFLFVAIFSVISV